MHQEIVKWKLSKWHKETPVDWGVGSEGKSICCTKAERTEFKPQNAHRTLGMLTYIACSSSTVGGWGQNWGLLATSPAPASKRDLVSKAPVESDRHQVSSFGLCAS